VDPSSYKPSSQFFYEDYKFFFNKLSAQPRLNQWPTNERMEFGRWVINTLTFKAYIETLTDESLQQYVDSLRAQFFPMIRYPNRVSEFSLPSKKDFKVTDWFHSLMSP
jgi:hypothetical protein